jgi:hypothetical protein
MIICAYEHPQTSAVWPDGIDVGRPHIQFSPWGEIYFWQDGKRIHVEKQVKPFNEYSIQELRNMCSRFSKG